MKKILLFSLVTITLFGLLFGWFIGSASAATMVPRRLDGVADFKASANRWPIAVMIDNHTSARPQASLQQAGVVYESLAEGGIPRFMAIYPNTAMGLVGPVRSTRPYFVRYAAEYGAAIAHAGGSPDALNLIKKLKLQSFWAIKGAYVKYYFRVGYGVHSLYTNGVNLKKAIQQAKLDKKQPTYRPWKFTIDPPLKKRATGLHGANIDLGYGKAYDIRYEYDRKNNVYKRLTGGKAHIDKVTRKQITVKNVIILVVPKEKVLDNKGRLDLHTIGHDRGVLMQNGRAINIWWTKKSDRSRTIFKDKFGREITLNAGNTWIEIVPRGHKYSIF